jgi:signal peptidase I
MSEPSKPYSPIHHPEPEENTWVEWAKVLGISVVLAIGIRQFLAEARFIPTESMLPTLQVDDRLIIEKVSYYFKSPARGDVIVFHPPDGLRQQQPNFNDALIKRVIGLPGETLYISGGQVFVNGQPISESYIAEAPNYEWGPAQIPDGEYFVLGDNRNRSNDSHFWGYVPEDKVIGRAAFRFWPLNRIGGIDPSPLYPDQSAVDDRPFTSALPFHQVNNHPFYNAVKP